MDDARIVSVHVGGVAPLGPRGTRSAFVKHAVSGPVAVGALGLDGDAQADPRVHGGPDKAVYGYPAAHYAAWRADFPEHAALFAPGGVGENLAIAGMDESDVHVGDVHALGTALLQVCQPRQPCFKFTLRFGDNRLAKAMVRNGRAGWYYRVLRPGVVAAGDRLTLRERPSDFPFTRLVAVINLGGATPDELARLAALPELASQWRDDARDQLAKIPRG
jgi:MOSC domain-containing protein YiiM